MMIKIAHLYPDMLNLYGDRGNIIALTKRMELRGISTQVDRITMGKSFNADDYDILFIGGGQDFEQDVLLEDLKKGKDKEIKRAVDSGKVMLAICGGYQMLGKYYKTYDGKMLEYIGALDFYTEGKEERMIGNFAYKTKEGIEVVESEDIEKIKNFKDDHVYIDKLTPYKDYIFEINEKLELLSRKYGKSIVERHR